MKAPDEFEVGGRYLVYEKTYAMQTREVTVKEIAPSGKFILFEHTGNWNRESAYLWEPSDKYTVVEQLPTREAKGLLHGIFYFLSVLTETR